jgi:hypothetical protein
MSTSASKFREAATADGATDTTASYTASAATAKSCFRLAAEEAAARKFVFKTAASITTAVAATN